MLFVSSCLIICIMQPQVWFCFEHRHFLMQICPSESMSMWIIQFFFSNNSRKNMKLFMHLANMGGLNFTAESFQYLCYVCFQKMRAYNKLLTKLFFFCVCVWISFKQKQSHFWLRDRGGHKAQRRERKRGTCVVSVFDNVCWGVWWWWRRSAPWAGS